MYNFPGGTCISISPVIAHGIPGDHVLKDGELINIDVSAELNGYFGRHRRVDGGCKACQPEYEKCSQPPKLR
jgi:hypothetical protein